MSLLQTQKEIAPHIFRTNTHKENSIVLIVTEKQNTQYAIELKLIPAIIRNINKMILLFIVINILKTHKKQQIK